MTIPLGAYVASVPRGKSPSLPMKSSRIPQAILGGALMGIGATIAGGDNIFHGLAGAPILALSSIVVMIFIFLHSSSFGGKHGLLSRRTWHDHNTNGGLGRRVSAAAA